MKKEITTEVKEADRLSSKEYRLTIKAEQALSLEVTDNKTLATSAEYLTEANRELDALTADKKKLTDPLNQSLKAIRAKYKNAEERLEQVISYLRGAQSKYATAVEAQKQKIAERVKSGTGNLKIETALSKIADIDVPDEVTTDNGSLKFRPHQTLKITNIDRIPRAFMVVNEAKLLEALKRGDEVEGAEILVIQIPINNRS